MPLRVQGLVEPMPIDDELVSGLARVDDVEGIAARFTIFTMRPCYEAGGILVPTVCRKLLFPYARISPALQMTTAFLAQRVVIETGHHFLHLIR